MPTPKQTFVELAASLPDDATYDDIMYRVYEQRQAERRLAATREDFEQMLFHLQVSGNTTGG